VKLNLSVFFIFLASFISIWISAYLFFISTEEDAKIMSIFVGLWPITIMTIYKTFILAKDNNIEIFKGK
jgi:hypothetical protein